MELRRSSWAIRPLSALVDRRAHARQVRGQRGGRCLQSTGPRLPGQERYETGQRCTCPPPPGLGLPAPSWTAGRDSRCWWHSARDTAPGMLLTDYSSPHVTDEEAGNSTSQQVRVDETPSGLAHPRSLRPAPPRGPHATRQRHARHGHMAPASTVTLPRQLRGLPQHLPGPQLDPGAPGDR